MDQTSGIEINAGSDILREIVFSDLPRIRTAITDLVQRLILYYLQRGSVPKDRLGEIELLQHLFTVTEEAPLDTLEAPQREFSEEERQLLKQIRCLEEHHRADTEAGRGNGGM